MILNFKFSNYRSFKNECVFTMEPSKSQTKESNLSVVETKDGSSLQALKVAIIFGANASGKTNIVKFLYRFRRWLLNLGNVAGYNISLYDPYKFDEDFVNQPSSFSIEFIVEQIRYQYHIEFSQKEVLAETLEYYPKGRTTLLFKREVGDSDYHQLVPGASVKVKSLKVFPNQLLLSKFVIDTPCEGITEAGKYLCNITISNGFHEDMTLGNLDTYLNWLRDKPSRIKRLGSFLEFANTGLKRFIAQRLGDGTFELKGFHQRFRENNEVGETDLPFQEESFGTRALVMLGCAILQSLEKGTPLIADEIDSGLHVYINRLIVDIFKNERINNKNAQLIFTTHNVTLLDQDNIRKDQVWFVEKDKYGSSELYALSDFEDVRETTPFAKWYINNKFGGVPTLKSLEQLFVEHDTKE